MVSRAMDAMLDTCAATLANLNLVEEAWFLRGVWDALTNSTEPAGAGHYSWAHKLGRRAVAAFHEEADNHE